MTTPVPVAIPTPAARERISGLRAGAIAIGNEVDKGLRFGWAERKQIALELAMFVPIFFLFAGVLGEGDEIVSGDFEWSFDGPRTDWLLVGFVFGMFFFLQVQKFFWRQLAEIQGGTLEQVYLSPLPWWLLAAVGRVLAAIVETLFVMGAVYLAVALTVGVDLAWHLAVSVPLLFLVAGSIGHTLLIGGLTMLLKRIEMLNETLLLLMFFGGGVFVPLDDMPRGLAGAARVLPLTHPIEAGRAILLDGDGLHLTGDGGLLPMAALAALWLAAGAVIFHRAAQRVRRDGTLTRY